MTASRPASGVRLAAACPVSGITAGRAFDTRRLSHLINGEARNYDGALLWHLTRLVRAMCYKAVVNGSKKVSNVHRAVLRRAPGH